MLVTINAHITHEKHTLKPKGLFQHRHKSAHVFGNF